MRKFCLEKRPAFESAFTLILTGPLIRPVAVNFLLVGGSEGSSVPSCLISTVGPKIAFVSEFVKLNLAPAVERVKTSMSTFIPAGTSTVSEPCPLHQHKRTNE